MKRHCRLREGGREGVWMSKFQIRSLREGKVEVAARACCQSQIHPEGLKITHAERGEVGEQFVEKMVSFDGSQRGLPPSSQTSAGFSARVRHERAGRRTHTGNTRKSDKRYIPIPKFLVQNQNTSKDILIFLSDSTRRHPPIPLLLLLLRLSGFQR